MGQTSKQKKLKKALSPLAELKKLGQVNGLIVNAEGAVPEEWRKADQQYFKEHPEETVYIRPAFPDEFAPSLKIKKVEVRVIAEGTRVRRPIQ